MIVFLFPRILGFKTFVVTSGSMEPLYPVGSLLYVKKTNNNEIKVGDSITFYLDNERKIIATHQVYEIDKENKEFKTQGINNKDEDGNIIHDAMPVKFSQVIGKPEKCIKKIGYINRLITTSPGIYVILLFTIFIILINSFLEKFNKEVDYEKSKEKK